MQEIQAESPPQLLSPISSQERSPKTKSIQQTTHSDHVVIVQNISQQDQQSSQKVDPLQQQLLSMKMTQNLANQISFNNSMNKFDNIEYLLHREHDKFTKKIQGAVNNQKEILKKIRAIRDSANYDQRKIRKIDQGKIVKDVKEVVEAVEDVAKYRKLSFAMIAALQDIQRKVDQRLGSPSSPLKSPKLTQLQSNHQQQKTQSKLQAQSQNKQQGQTQG